MTINYDPDKAPKIPDEMIQKARELGLYVVHIICDEQWAETTDLRGVTFMAMTPMLPRQGDRIGLEDGKFCDVLRIDFSVHEIDGQKALFPNVYAMLIPDGNSE